MAIKYRKQAYDYTGTYNKSIQLFQIFNLTTHDPLKKFVNLCNVDFL